MITVDKITYFGGERKILDAVSLIIADGEKVAIVGPNGAGKSTLIKIIMGRLAADEGKIVIPKGTGVIGYMPQSLEKIEVEISKSVLDFMLSGRGLDHITEKLNVTMRKMNRPSLSNEESMMLATEYSEAFEEFLRQDGYKAETELLEILVGLGLSSVDLGQKVGTLSGGQKTKLAFARVLFSQPRLMILDEPTNHLDETTVEWVVEFLGSYKGTLLIVSHEPSVLDALVSRVVFMNGHGGAHLYKGNFTDFQKKKGQLEEAQSRLQAKQGKEEAELIAFISKWRGRKPTMAKDREKKLQRLRREMVQVPKEEGRLALSFPVNQIPTQKILEVLSISKSYGSNSVLKDVNFELFRDERMAIMGPNGAGKTTLLRIIANVTSPDSGMVKMGERVDFGYYTQERDDLEPRRTVLEEMQSASSYSQTRLRSILAHFLFPGDKVLCRVGVLSFGERSRLSLAKLVVSGHNLLLLDEPTNHLDVLAREQLKQALKLYQGTILIISHDREFLEGVGAQKVLLLPENVYGFIEQLAQSGQ